MDPVTTPVIERLGLDEAGRATGIAVVIDVIRAFSVAAYALAAGAERLWLVRTAEEAFALRERAPDALLAGEIGGRLIPGFDLNNSPATMARSDVRGRTIIQRTGAGTQGACLAAHASHLFVASLVNARATAQTARVLAEETGRPISLIPTDRRQDLAMSEDDLCADYLTALLTEPERAVQQLDAALQRFRASGRLDIFREGDSDFPPEDIDHALAVDRFDFAMPGVPLSRDGIPYVEVTASFS